MSGVETSVREAKGYPSLPTLVGLGLALLGPFVFQWFIDPILKQLPSQLWRSCLDRGFFGCWRSA